MGWRNRRAYRRGAGARADVARGCVAVSSVPACRHAVCVQARDEGRNGLRQQVMDCQMVAVDRGDMQGLDRRPQLVALEWRVRLVYPEHVPVADRLELALGLPQLLHELLARAQTREHDADFVWRAS